MLKKFNFRAFKHSEVKFFHMNKLFEANYNIFLASTSPRRLQFFQELGFDFEPIKPSNEEDSPYCDELPSNYAMRVAKTKALYADTYLRNFGQQNQAYVIIAADTVVSIDGIILGKPKDNLDALRMLKMLNGKTHIVTTSVHIIENIEQNKHTSFANETKVTFANFSDKVLKNYANCGEPLDKAGSYAIQGQGAFLVSSIDGCWANVVGLPVNTLVEILLRRNIIRTI